MDSLAGSMAAGPMALLSKEPPHRALLLADPLSAGSWVLFVPKGATQTALNDRVSQPGDRTFYLS